MTSDFPLTQYAIQFVGKDEIVVNPAKAVPQVGPRQILLQVEASGICFSDTKLLHAFDAHPRKSAVLRGLDPAELAEIPGYVPGQAPVVPGHEPVGRIVAVGSEVTRHKVGERVLVQTDYRHLPTAGSNAAFGYNFDGALQEYVLMDERVIIDPQTGERFLLPVGEEPSASAVALVEPWACVEAAYAWSERQTLRPGGRMLVVRTANAPLTGLDALLAAAPGSPSAIDVVDEPSGVADDGVADDGVADDGVADDMAAFVDTLAQAAPGVPITTYADVAAFTTAYDDIIYAGADAATIEALGPRLAAGGVLDIVLGGARIGRRVAIDVGRVHYDLIRYVGTTGHDAAAGYARIPARCEIREGEKVAIIGAAGPMGLMHTARTATSGVQGVSMDAIDVDDARLATLARLVEPIATARGVPTRFINSLEEALEPGYTYVSAMVPVPALLAQAVDLTGEDGVVNAFAGFPVGTLADLDLDGIIERRIYLVGTSGSRIEDMAAVLAKLTAGDLDTNISLDAVCGMAGFRDAIGSVIDRTAGGKIMVYPMLHDLPLVRLVDLPTVRPDVASLLADGLWTKAAEKALLGGPRAAVARGGCEGRA